LEPGQAVYFRVRTLSFAHTYYESGLDWPAFNHPYVQPNNLWSGYTPVVCIHCPGAPSRTFLPLVG
jgi:hypothetical protein